MSTEIHHQRFADRALLEALTDTPVVLVHGPRQCGKSTLAKDIGESKGYTYFSFDSATTLGAAVSDPMGFIADLPQNSILDEVQRVPFLFTAIKSAVDTARRPGQFILTGSANILLLPTLADSLAGRMEILRLHPLAQCELAGQLPSFLDTVFDGAFTSHRYGRLGTDLADRIVAGGFPAALARSNPRRRAVWYRDYIETQVQRDVHDMARISSLHVLPRLLAFAASVTARLLNISAMAAPFQLSRPTIKDYVALLERVFLIDQLQPWHSNRLSRLVKSPKMHVVDTGLACALLGLTAETLLADRTLLGQMLETFVYQELRKQASWRDDDIRFHHFRDKDGIEVDIVLERGPDIVGIEVKASATVTSADFRGLRKLREASDKRFVAGIVLYDGDDSVGFGDGMYAVPVKALWEIV